MKPILRTETPTERRLKRQLRRFITIAVYALNCRQPPASMGYRLYRNDGTYQQFVMWDILGRFPTPRMPIAKTPAEKQLRSVYNDIRRYITNTRKRGDFSANLHQGGLLLSACKQALHATRKDKMS